MARVVWEIDFDDSDVDSLRGKHGLEGQPDDVVFAAAGLYAVQNANIGDFESCNYFLVDGRGVDLGEVEL